jgi:2-polyprenyl-3-methyl-5-hydroxy-6-metoxy-1,4-benzoquinol methylase
MGYYVSELAAPDAAPAQRVQWEETNCPLCDGPHWSLLTEAPDLTPGGSGLWFAVVRCRDCGLCYTNPRPDAATIRQFYPPIYATHQAPHPARHSRRRGPTFPVFGQGRLLDFGCGGGAFLGQMHRQGWRVTGVDICEEAVTRARGELGLPALAGTLPHPELPEASFDAITMRQSLEHVHAPLEVLQAAHRLLAPGGRLFVAVPNIDSAAFRWCGPAWIGLDLPRHLTHFTPRTLRQMLEAAGFRAGAVRMVRHSSWLRKSARRAGQHLRGNLWHRWLSYKPTSRLATWYSYLTRQADCISVTATRGE